MTSSSDQNLLFGIIALQMDFVRREQLVAATSTWLTDKSRKIEEILVEQGALSEEDRNLLAPLVARHLENHGGDPQQSLAALSSIGSVADELRSLGDKKIEATLSMVASDPVGHHAETVAHESKASTATNTAARDSTDARFRILRSHAKGGLGEVFVAKDTELSREVALKEIQTKFADDESSRLRFLLEAEVTGGLEHPGIVPVYGLGRYEDGRPFYAMRFIKGDSLQAAADRFHVRAKSNTTTGEGEKRGDSPSHAVDFIGLEFRKLLGRFVDVCQAIEYAHSRGVLHRDLKPGNVMLGKYGETLVVDWGLAKAQGRDETTSVEGETTLRPASASGSAPTMMGSAIGTPAFMPPEQAAGRLDELGPASDVSWL
jgi:serine/threonine-protein kinase